MNKQSLLILGLVEGFASASLGIGGGVIVIPSLMFFYQYKRKDALGLSLASVAPPVTLGLLSHAYLDPSSIFVGIAGLIVIGSIFGVSLGKKIEKHVNGDLLSILFGILLIFSAAKLFGLLSAADGPALSYALLPVLGIIAGICSALFGIGGGIIIVPALTLYFGLSIHEAIPTSLLVIMPTVIMASLKARPDKQALAYMVPMALFGSVIGAFSAYLLPAQALQAVFGILLIAAAMKIFILQESIDVMKKSLALLHVRL